MGLYATTTSISELLPQFLKGNTTTSDTGGTSVFSRHIDRAEGDVNSALVSRFALPFTTVPPIVRTISEDIACYYALRASIAQDGQVDNKQIERFERAFDKLTKLQDGSIALAYTDGSLVPARTSTRFLSSSEGYAPTFDLDAPKDWKVDADRLDDISDGRE